MGKKKPKVKCPGCEERFYREDEPFVHLKNRYWHTTCYNETKEKQEKEEKDKKELENYICELFDTTFVSPRIKRQINSYIDKNNYTHSGILGSLKYWFGIKGESIKKANGGIGIVPYIYEQAEEYYREVYKAQQNNKGVTNIEMEERLIKITSPKRDVKEIKTINLDFLEEGEGSYYEE